MSVRDSIAFMAWLDTAQAFRVKQARSQNGRVLPVQGALTREGSHADTPIDCRIGAALIAQDEETLIGRALASVRPFVDEIVVVDGGSRDTTTEQAVAFGARVVERAFDGDYSAQRNFGLQYIRTPWVFMIDADEILPPDLGELLLRLASLQWVDVVFVPRLNLFADAENELISWPDLKLRLFRRGIRFRGRLHEQLVGWSRPVYTPISGPYLEHRTTRLRVFRRSLFYASLDPTPYSEEWLAWAKSEIVRLEAEAPINGESLG